MPPLQGLTVFISSSIKEFGNTRARLKNEISQIGYLTSLALEKEGARPVPVEEESLNKASESDIFVGIFGESYSELTAKEYYKAKEAGRPCFIYVLKDVKRDEKLTQFLRNEVAKSFKFQEFSSTAELIENVVNDLSVFMGEIIRRGIKDWTGKGVVGSGEIQRIEESVTFHNQPVELPPLQKRVADYRSGKTEVKVERDEQRLDRQFSTGSQRIRILGKLRSTKATRFKELANMTGIYGAVLWFRLSELVSEGLIMKMYQSPKHVTYQVTVAGMRELADWLDKTRSR